ncbi:hypothetical protein N7G274_005035 [Stereocaulon virgatum]|uniref:Uncharacterized protein n=1 Tax=Stereocaulon virgatum TaxID=373712 RepID=A0ABR4ACF8_9LECA
MWTATLRNRAPSSAKSSQELIDYLVFACWTQWLDYDLVTKFDFGQSVGFVGEGKDVGGLIQSFHDMAPMADLVAALPWLMNPSLKNPVFKRFMMPRARDKTGTGKMMKYRDDILDHRLKNRTEEGHNDFLSKLVSDTLNMASY